jgi:WD40 repeat protein
MSKILLLALAATLSAADKTLPSDAAPGDLFFSGDGKTISSKCRDGHLRIWDLATGKVVADKTYMTSSGMASGNILVEIDRKAKETKVWDLTANRQLYLLNGADMSRATSSADGRYLATSNPVDRTIRVLDLKTGKERHSLPDGLGGAAGITFSPDGETVVSANYDNDIRVWKTASGELVKKVEDLTGAMFASEFTPDGKHLVMAGLDETVYIWDAKTFALNRKLKGHGETISALALSPDGRTLVTGGFDVITVQNPVKIQVWDFASGKITRTIASPHRVVSLAFSPDGKWLAFTSGDKEISLVSLAAAK